jgi:uncharacterized membrane protein
MANSKKQIMKKRLVFIDVMRGIAVLWMIETHVLNVFFASSLKHGAIYTLLGISNGFVAVAFIFCAGTGFWLAAMKKKDDYKHFNKPLFDYLRHLFFILIIAYLLHLPSQSFGGLFALPSSSWIVFFENDILQCIVYTSLFSLLVLMLMPKFHYLPWIFVFLTLFVFFASPFILSWDAMQVLPPFIGALFTGLPVSKFPMTPWSGYFFAGIATTTFFMNSENKHKIAWLYFAGGLALSFYFQYSKSWGVCYPEITNWWYGSPGHSAFRLSGTIVVFGPLFLLEKYLKKTSVGKMLQLSGQESLFLYVSHLLLVYNSSNLGINNFIGTGFGYLDTFLIFAGITLLCYFIAFHWHKLKIADLKKARLVIALSGLLLTIFYF